MNFNFNINWSLLIKRIVDPERRYPIRLKWIFALITPVINVHNQFLDYRTQVLNRLKYNAQVMYLERGLNDVFNVNYPATFTLPIYIEHPSSNIPEVLFYRDSDAQNTPIIYRDSDGISTFLMFRDSDYENEFDYIIKVPITLYDFGAAPQKIDEIRAFVNLYNVCGMRYNVINY